ncbi:MAG: hypothetical protein R2697_02880 [Ilumatobacteraceae bacterium]
MTDPDQFVGGRGAEHGEFVDELAAVVVEDREMALGDRRLDVGGGAQFGDDRRSVAGRVSGETRGDRDRRPRTTVGEPHDRGGVDVGPPLVDECGECVVVEVEVGGPISSTRSSALRRRTANGMSVRVTRTIDSDSKRSRTIVSMKRIAPMSVSAWSSSSTTRVVGRWR